MSNFTFVSALIPSQNTDYLMHQIFALCDQQ